MTTEYEDEMHRIALAAVDEALAKCAHLDPRLREIPREVLVLFAAHACSGALLNAIHAQVDGMIEAEQTGRQ